MKIRAAGLKLTYRWVVVYALVVSACPAVHAQITGSRDVYDITGNRIFGGEVLMEMSALSKSGGGSATDYVNNDRFYRDFGSYVRVSEWINSSEYELVMGRVGTWFTPLTLHKERFRPGYTRMTSPYWHERWYSQRTIRLRATNGPRETMLLFAKTANANNDDEDWGYPAAFDDIDIDRYFTAFRHRFNLLGQTVGLSFVNEHFTREQGGSIDPKAPLRGDVPDDTPSVIYVRIVDDSPKDDQGNPDQYGAMVYNVRVDVNGSAEATLSVTNGTTLGANAELQGNYLPYADHVEAIGPDNWGFSHAIKYKFTLPSPQTSKSIKFYADVAGDYKIQISKDDASYSDVARAEGNVKDASNRKTEIFSYDKLTGQSIFGIDFHGVLPFINVGYNFEFARSFRYGRYPVQGGAETQTHGDAWYTELSRDFGRTLFVTKFWDFDYNYDASFSVEDNDNKNDMPDVVDWYVSFQQDLDKNNEGGADYEEDWLLLTVDPPQFLEGVDYNNNDVQDEQENDAKPDYPNNWMVGTHGYHVTGAWKPLMGLRLTGGYRDEKNDMDATFNKLMHSRARYSFGIPGGDALIRFEWRKAKDIITNDVVSRTDANDQRTEDMTDPLDYRNTIRMQADATVNFKLFDRLYLTTRYAQIYQDRKHSNTNVNEGLAILRGKYDNWFPFRRMGFLTDWQLLPLFKFQRSFKSLDVAGDRSNVSDTFTQSFAIEAIRKFSDKTSVFLGHQVILRSDFLNANDISRNISSVQLIHKDQYWGKDLMITTGVNFIKQSGERTWNDFEGMFSYVKSYFVW